MNYTTNTAIIVNGSSPAGTAGDTDSLTLRGTDPANPGTSGNDDVIANFTAAGNAANPLVRVYDAGAIPPAVRPSAAEVADTGGAAANIIYACNRSRTSTPSISRCWPAPTSSALWAAMTAA